jgi:hypothetical protein
MMIMSGVIFLIQEDKLAELREEKYNSEDLFQKLLADYPKILAGDQIDSENPRRWLLIAREQGVQDEKSASYRWSLDHLFIDQEGIPTFVEVKRSTDTRARREVVAQMLDYAANGIEYWEVSEIKAQFEQKHSTQGENPEQVMKEALGPETDYEKTWNQMRTNLEQGKVRLLFVADEIPKELKRIVEFLNEKMADVEVLAVEVKQFNGENLKTLVPRVIGQTSQAEIVKGKVAPRKWDKESFLAELEIRKGAVDRKIMEDIFVWIEREKIDYKFGSGKKVGTCGKIILNGDEVASPFSFQTDGRVFVQFDRLSDTVYYTDIQKRQELAGRLNRIPGIKIRDNTIGSWPAFPLSLLKDEKTQERFFQIFSSILKNLGKSV